MRKRKAVQYAFALYFLGLWVDILGNLIEKKIEYQMKKGGGLSNRCLVALTKNYEKSLEKWKSIEQKYIELMDGLLA